MSKTVFLINYKLLLLSLTGLIKCVIKLLSFVFSPKNRNAKNNTKFLLTLEIPKMYQIMYANMNREFKKISHFLECVSNKIK